MSILTNVNGGQIRTQKLGLNYGGALQAFALQRIICSLGSPATLAKTNFFPPKLHTPGNGGRARQVVGTLLGYWGPISPRGFLGFALSVYLSGSIRRFARQHGLVEATCKDLAPNFYIVGSDQVWRPAYSDINWALFGDVTSRSGVQKFSYAASFGTDQLDEWTPELRIRTVPLAQRLNAISVREKSGVQMVKELWGRDDAQWHVDPTMLLNRAEYDKLIEEEFPGLTPLISTNSTTDSRDTEPIASYVLDKRDDIAIATAGLAGSLGVEVNQLLKDTPANAKAYLADPERYNKISVPAWLKGIRDAKLLVTDSFHGCVFAILFHTPFIVVPNGARGRARFDSLLGLFDLTDRMVDPNLADFSEAFADVALRPIDWPTVDAILQRERQRGIAYLRENLEPAIKASISE